MDANDRLRIENLERAVSGLADALEHTIALHGLGWTHWRGKALEAHVRAAKDVLGEPTVSLPDTQLAKAAHGEARSQR